MDKNLVHINGVDFEIRPYKGSAKHERILDIIRTSKTLDECYGRPSTRKQAIYDKWIEWVSNVNNIYGFGIHSYNTNIFTLQGYIIFKDEIYGIIDITPTHNYIYV